jgi:hypothetical protein
MKVTMIVGLPASGKTHYAETIANGRKIVDDPQSLSDLEGMDNDFIICDPHLCHVNKFDVEDRIKKVYPEAVFEWIYFENDPEQCLKNAKNRLDKKVDNFIKLLAKQYVIPINAKVLPVWKG